VKEENTTNHSHFNFVNYKLHTQDHVSSSISLAVY